MGRVMIHCPRSGLPVETGIGMDQQTFERSELRDNSVSCSDCGDEHTWSKEDAFVLGD